MLMKLDKMEESFVFEKTDSLWKKKEASIWGTFHCVKNVQIQSYFGPHFPIFGMSEYRKLYSSPNTGN